MIDEHTYRQIVGLRARRSYRPDPLSDDHLSKILEAARWTGSSKNRQNWSIVLIRDDARREALASCGDFTDPVRAAPVVLALVQEPDGYEFDTGRLAQNVMLAAATVGVASCPITLHDDDRAATVLGLPDGARCRYAVAMGYPAETARPARLGGRKPLGDVVRSERYDDR